MPFDIQALPNGKFQWVSAPALDEYSDLDLYLMGLLAPSDVKPNLVANDQTKQPCAGCAVSVTTLMIDDVIKVAGPRVPGFATSQKMFRIGTVVISRDRLLNDDEIALLDYFAARGEAKTPIPGHSGLAAPGLVNPFYIATRKVGTLNMRIDITDRALFARSVTPNVLPLAGGLVSVTGTGFAGLVPITVTVDGVPATEVKVTPSHLLTFVAPHHAAGKVDLVINGQIGSVHVPDALMYQ